MYAFEPSISWRQASECSTKEVDPCNLRTFLSAPVLVILRPYLFFSSLLCYVMAATRKPGSVRSFSLRRSLHRPEDTLRTENDKEATIVRACVTVCLIGIVRWLFSVVEAISLLQEQTQHKKNAHLHARINDSEEEISRSVLNP